MEVEAVCSNQQCRFPDVLKLLSFERQGFLDAAGHCPPMDPWKPLHQRNNDVLACMLMDNATSEDVMSG